MVHKKYKWKNGKRYGPYYYENKRVGEKVITTYLGKSGWDKVDKDIRYKNKLNYSYLSIGIILLILLTVFFVGEIKRPLLSPQGEQLSILLSKQSYSQGDKISGEIKL